MQRYSIDPGQMSLRFFFDLTKDRRMLPGREMLHDHMEERFLLLSSSGMESLADLLDQLGSEAKLADFAFKSGLDITYLHLLKREAGSYLARPFPLSEFPGIPFEYTELLKSKGIASTRKFFELARTPSQRKVMSGSTGIPEARLEELFALCDLSRITGVGGSMARIIYQAGIRSTAEFAVTRLRFEDQFREEDIQYCLDYAKVIAEMDAIKPGESLR